MLDKKTRDLVSFLDGSLRNCESVLFTPPDPSSTTPSLTHSIPSLRPDLSARQVAKLYGFTQKLLTKHVDQIGLGLDPGDSWYQEEIKPVRKAFVHRCNLILDKLEEKNSNTKTEKDSNISNDGGDEEDGATGSVHNIMIMNGVVYGSIFLRKHQVTLYVKPLLVSESTHEVDTCRCSDPPSIVSSVVSLMEFIISTTQQRLLDDGILEFPSRDFNITSYEAMAARSAIHAAVNESIPKLPLYESFGGTSHFNISFRHPHESVLAEVMKKSTDESTNLFMFLSEEGTYCHVTLASLKTHNSVSSTSVIYQDKYLVKREGTQTGKRPHRKVDNNFGDFFMVANQFVNRLENDFNRAVSFGNDDGNSLQWKDVTSVRFLHDGNNHECDRIVATEKNDLQMWLEAALVTSIGSSPLMLRYSYVTDINTSDLYYCQSPLGSAIGIRVHNLLSVVKQDSTNSSGDSDEQKTSFIECSDYIPLLEPFQTVPVCVRHRLRGSKVACKEEESMTNIVINVVEESRCSRGVQCSHNSNHVHSFNHSSNIGHVVHSLLCGEISVARTPRCESEPGGNSNQTEVEVLVEICVDEYRNVTLRVLDEKTNDTLVISTSTKHESLLSTSNVLLKSIRPLSLRKDIFVTEFDTATNWTCDELASGYKQRGNAFMKDQDYFGAIKMYTGGLACAAPGESAGILASNRCAAFTHLNFLPAALEDARDCVRHCPQWEKGWARLGSVQFRMKCLDESLLSYEKAVSFAPTNVTILDALQEVRDVVMVRQAEAAAIEAKSKNSTSQSPQPSKKDDKNCNDVCVIS